MAWLGIFVRRALGFGFWNADGKKGLRWKDWGCFGLLECIDDMVGLLHVTGIPAILTLGSYLWPSTLTEVHEDL